MSNTRVAWEGSQFVYHSLAHVNRELCLALVQAGQVDLSIIPYEPDQFQPVAVPRYKPLQQRVNRPLSGRADVHVRHQWPPKFSPPEHGAWVMIQPWEFGGIPQEWVEPMRDMVDEIWVPSSYVREGYIRSGIPGDKVVVIPNGVDLNLYTPKGPRYRLETQKTCKLLYVGGLIARKGVDALLESYTRTFTRADDVCLVIKAAGIGTFYGDSPFVRRIQNVMSDPAAPEIELITDELSDAQMASLYRVSDALVHPYRGEGFGMPISEAMASGLPVVVTNYGACLDFCDAETARLVMASEQPIETHGLPEASIGYWWAEPDIEALGAEMRWIVANPEAARAMGERGRKRMRDFTWERAAEHALDRIEALSHRRPLRAQRQFQLEGRRQVAFFHHPKWQSNAWQEVLRTYWTTFSDADDATLVLWLDPNQGVSLPDARNQIMDVIASTGGDPEGGPDLLLVPERLDLKGITRLYAAVDVVVPNGDALQAQRGRAGGARLLDHLSPSAWRAALAS
jgi:glycosyltransferase involved in cell wall biosynthesis